MKVTTKLVVKPAIDGVIVISLHYPPSPEFTYFQVGVFTTTHNPHPTLVNT